MVLVDYYKNNLMCELFPRQVDESEYKSIENIMIDLNKINKEMRKYKIKKTVRNIKKRFTYIFENQIYQVYLAGYATGISFYFFNIKLLYINIMAGILLIIGITLFIYSLIIFWKKDR